MADPSKTGCILSCQNAQNAKKETSDDWLERCCETAGKRFFKTVMPDQKGRCGRLKTDRNKFYITYTILFVSFALIAFSTFFLRGKSFIWQVDGLYQHYNAFVYYGEWLREIVRILACEHRLEVPLWE